MNAILRLKESGELVAMSRDTCCRDLRVIRIVGIIIRRIIHEIISQGVAKNVKKLKMYIREVFMYLATIKMSLA